MFLNQLNTSGILVVTHLYSVNRQRSLTKRQRRREVFHDYANQNTKQYADVLILKQKTSLKSTTRMQHVLKWLGSGSVDGEGKVGEKRL